VERSAQFRSSTATTTGPSAAIPSSKVRIASRTRQRSSGGGEAELAKGSTPSAARRRARAARSGSREDWLSPRASARTPKGRCRFSSSAAPWTRAKPRLWARSEDFGYQPALADTGFAFDEEHGAATQPGTTEEAVKLFNFGGPAHQANFEPARRHTRHAPRPPSKRHHRRSTFVRREGGGHSCNGSLDYRSGGEAFRYLCF